MLSVHARGDEPRRLADQHGLLPHPPRDVFDRVERRRGVVSSARTISTSFILCTGLKKCMPATRDGRVSEPAISVMLSADVLVATMASAGASAFDIREELELQVDALGRRLDHEVRARERRRRRRVETVSRARLAAASAAEAFPKSTDAAEDAVDRAGARGSAATSRRRTGVSQSRRRAPRARCRAPSCRRRER